MMVAHFKYLRKVVGPLIYLLLAFRVQRWYMNLFDDAIMGQYDSLDKI